jgi:hypothetical protein
MAILISHGTATEEPSFSYRVDNKDQAHGGCIVGTRRRLQSLGRKKIYQIDVAGNPLAFKAEEQFKQDLLLLPAIK